MFLNHLFLGAPEEQPTQKFWFPIPEDKADVSKMNQIEKRIQDEILKLHEAENLDPTRSGEEEKKILSNFVWEGSILKDAEKGRFEKLIVKYNDIFARHRLDVGINNEFKV